MYAKSFLIDNVPTINIEDLFDVSGAQIVDVRTPEEFVGELGHVENAKLVTLGPELDHFLQQVDPAQIIVFVCRSGARSARATQYAQSLGFKEVYNLMGGMIAWNEKGYKSLK